MTILTRKPRAKKSGLVKLLALREAAKQDSTYAGANSINEVAIRIKSGMYGLNTVQIGDRVDVVVNTAKGKKSYSGTVVAREGSGSNESFTLRYSQTTKPITLKRYAPEIVQIKIDRASTARLAKFYYLRPEDRRSARLREQIRARSETLAKASKYRTSS